MPLPILTHHPAPSDDDLVRLFGRTELLWVGQMSEETVLDCGVAFTNPLLANVHDANLILDASIADGSTAADAIAEADRHFAAQGVRCWKWSLNRSLPADRTQSLGERLISSGCRTETFDILYLGGAPTGVIEEVGGLQIIPARASFRHARQILEESVARWNEPQLVEAGVLRLEDPQTDALLALEDGKAVAMVSVLTVGELGRIEDVFVSERLRRRGIGRTMMSRALEICARGLLRHVFLSVEKGNLAAHSLYAKCGFRRLAEGVVYRVASERP